MHFMATAGDEVGIDISSTLAAL